MPLNSSAVEQPDTDHRAGTDTSARAKWLAVALTYAALTLAMFWPIAHALRRAVPHDLGDPLLNMWILWWNSTRIPFSHEWWQGPAFWPLPNSLALSENLFGVSILSTPLHWVGADPITAYNAALLLSWPFSALAAHGLAYRLTRRHDASLIGGVVFGFSPYRLAQVPHIQVLCSWWMPLALLSLHAAVEARTVHRRVVWLTAFTALWCVQALSNGYFLVYFSIIVGLWLVWFTFTTQRLALSWQVIGCWILGIAAVFPVIEKYRTVHQGWQLHRSISEIVSFSGDVLSFLTAPSLLSLWRYRPILGPEQELYPGLIATCLVGVGVVVSLRREHASARRVQWVQRTFLCVSVVFGLAAIVTLAWGPWNLDLGIASISNRRFRKPLTLAVVCLLVAAFLETRLARPYKHRSALLFYVLATVFVWFMCLGPVGRIGGVWVLERPPYWWLVQLPGLDALRVPTRFALIGTLTLSVAAALAFTKLVKPGHRWLPALITLALVMDAWPRPMPMRQPPQLLTLPEQARHAAILEIPLGAGVEQEVSAMYRGMFHGRPVVNGYSGYHPPAYRILRTALREGDGSVLSALAEFSPLCIVLDRRTGEADRWLQSLAEMGGAPIGTAGGYAFYLLEGQEPRAVMASSIGPARDVVRWKGRLDWRLGDGDITTAWSSRAPQRGGERFALTLTKLTPISGVQMSTGDRIHDYPRLLVVETSVDGSKWDPAWHGATAGLAYLASMKDPSTNSLIITFPPRDARVIRLRQVGRSREFHWSIAELEILGPSRPPTDDDSTAE